MSAISQESYFEGIRDYTSDLVAKSVDNMEARLDNVIYKRSSKNIVEVAARCFSMLVQTAYMAICALTYLVFAARISSSILYKIPYFSVIKEPLINIHNWIQKSFFINMLCLSIISIVTVFFQTPITLVDTRRAHLMIQASSLAQNRTVGQLTETLTTINNRFLRSGEELQILKLETSIGQSLISTVREKIPTLLRRLRQGDDRAFAEAQNLLADIRRQSKKHLIIHGLSLTILVLTATSAILGLVGITLSGAIIPVSSAIFLLYLVQYIFSKTVASHLGWHTELSRLVPDLGIKAFYTKVQNSVIRFR